MESDLKWALALFQQRAEEYKLSTDYFEGKHRLDFVPNDFRRDFAALLRRARLNLCPAVVTSVRDRLKLSSLTGEENNTKVTDAISAIWRRNRMEQRAGEVHTESLTTGDAYLVVWPSMESGLVTLYPNKARMIVVQYDDEEPDLIIKAAKWWVTDEKTVALCLYYPDSIEEYYSNSKAGQGVNLTANSFVLEDVKLNPYGRVPVFHFGNGANVGGYGVSELREAIPIQDMLNKTVRDMLLGGEEMALPQRWATGIEVPMNDGVPVNNFVPGDFWAARSESAAFGQLDAANLDQLLKVKDGYKMDMAMVTGIPPHMFFAQGGESPSGEALKTLEFRLSSKVEDRQVSFGNEWESVFKFALQIQGMQETELDAVWTDTTPRNEQEYQSLVIERTEKLGVPKRQGLRELEYTEEEIERMQKEQAKQGVVDDLMGVTQGGRGLDAVN